MKEVLKNFFKNLSELDFTFQANAEKVKDRLAQYWRTLKIILKKIPFVAYLVKQRNKLRKAYKASEFYKKKEEKINNILTPEIRKKIWDIKRSFAYKFAPRATAIVVAGIIALVILNNTSDAKQSSASEGKKIVLPTSKEVEADKNKAEVTPNPDSAQVDTSKESTNPEEFVATEDNSKWLVDAKINVFPDANYITKNGYKFYYNDKKQLSSWLGVDVSSHQGTIDWKKVKKTGIKFAMIRVGARGYKTGKIQYDQYFKYNIENAKKNGIRVGVYFFSQAINTKEALEEANFVLNCIQGYKLDMPVVFDQEYAASESCRLKLAGLTNEERTDIAITFLEQVKKKGYFPMFYANKVWLEQAVQLSRLNDYAVWYARYNNVPDYKYRYYMWQYTKTGKITGINGNVDINVCLVNFDKYIK